MAEVAQAQPCLGARYNTWCAHTYSSAYALLRYLRLSILFFRPGRDGVFSHYEINNFDLNTPLGLNFAGAGHPEIVVGVRQYCRGKT
jgi:hypothetical protein